MTRDRARRTVTTSGSCRERSATEQVASGVLSNRRPRCASVTHGTAAVRPDQPVETTASTHAPFSPISPWTTCNWESIPRGRHTAENVATLCRLVQ